MTDKHQCHGLYCYCTYIPYSRKYWRSIKFGGLAVGEATVKFRSVKFKCDLRECVRAYYMYGTTAKFKSANIFISAARDQTAKFKDRQYFWLYGIVCNSSPFVLVHVSPVLEYYKSFNCSGHFLTMHYVICYSLAYVKYLNDA